ncbi:hypothetical protein N7467_008305 [Penicillium canescens]|nr:hypothetical protein N7467_008305 [Penicillium canescens]
MPDKTHHIAVVITADDKVLYIRRVRVAVRVQTREASDVLRSGLGGYALLQQGSDNESMRRVQVPEISSCTSLSRR